MVTRFVLHGFVLVAEDEEINRRVKGGLLLSVLVKASVGDVVVIAALHFVFELFQTVVVRPFQGQTNAKIGMYQPEQELIELTFKDLLQKFVAVVSWTSAIAMDQKELLAFNRLDDRLAVHLKTQFVVQVTETPKVVVADEHVHRNARIGKLSQLALQSDKASGNHRLVLKPKIKKVTHQVKFLAVGTNHVQEAQQLALALLAVLK